MTQPQQAVTKGKLMDLGGKIAETLPPENELRTHLNDKCCEVAVLSGKGHLTG